MSKVLSGGNQAGLTLWQTPAVDEGSKTSQLTPQELANLEKQSRDKGFDEGHRDGLLAGSEELQQQVLLLKQMLGAMEKPFEKIEKKVEEELVLLAATIAEHVVKQELTADPSLIRQTVEQAVSALSPTAHQVSVHLHPQDIALLNTIQDEGYSSGAWQMIEDASLERGECHIDSSEEFVDATIHNRINAIVNQSFGVDIAADRKC